MTEKLPSIYKNIKFAVPSIGCSLDNLQGLGNLDR